jgi:hypothetical protein
MSMPSSPVERISITGWRSTPLLVGSGRVKRKLAVPSSKIRNITDPLDSVEALRGFAIGPLAYDMWIAESATKGGPGGL